MLDKVFSQFEANENEAAISITPLVDLVFILLIFFVVTTSFVKEAGIVVDKASASTTQPLLNQELLLVAVDQGGRYWLDGREQPLDSLVDALDRAVRATGDRGRIVIVPDQRCTVQPLVWLMDRLRARNLTRFAIGTKPTEALP